MPDQVFMIGPVSTANQISKSKWPHEMDMLAGY